jgi:short-subunit dehydrogenase
VARQSNGPVDVLINNAGLIRVGPLEEMRMEDYEEAMRVHFWAALFTSLEVIPEMKSRQKGRILNISSIGGKIAVPHLLPYTGSKFALVGLSHGLRVELARYGITVTTVCPGLMRTGSHIHAEFKGQNEKEYAWFATGGSLPGFSMNVERAARKILTACARGDAEVVLGLPAKLAVAAQGMFPNVTSTLLGLVDHWIMPNPGGIHTASAKGRNSRDWLPEFVTTLSDRAADQNNEAASAGVPPPLPAGRH